MDATAAQPWVVDDAGILLAVGDNIAGRNRKVTGPKGVP